MSVDTDDEPPSPWNGSQQSQKEIDDAFRMARVFFLAATKLSENNEDILPQEDGEGVKLSVFSVFASLFPDAVGNNGGEVKNKRMRLHFNKIGYQIYGKEQSRRVPSLRAKPGNPGYGFRRARWRDTIADVEDSEHCAKVLRAAGCTEEKVKQVMACVQECRHLWDAVRRPSRPAGPGRPPRRLDNSPHTQPAQSPMKETPAASSGEAGAADPIEPRQISPSERAAEDSKPQGSLGHVLECSPISVSTSGPECSPGLKRCPHPPRRED